MIRLACVLVFAIAASAEVTAPLGGGALPGVPVLLKSDAPAVVELDGWRYDVDGWALVAPPQLPCVVRDATTGEELFRLTALDAPLAGAPPPDLPAWCRPALRLFAAGGPIGKPVGDARPDLYDLVKPPAPRSAARAASRWIIGGAAAAMALLLFLRRRLAALVVVAAVAAVVGWIRTNEDYRAVATGRIEVVHTKGAESLLRTYWVYRAAGPGAAADPPAHALPVFRRVGEDAWDPEMRAGAVRIYVTEEVAAPKPPPTGLAPGDAPLPLKKFWRRERPSQGVWTAVLSGEPAPPVAAPGAPPVLVRLWIAAQD